MSNCVYVDVFRPSYRCRYGSEEPHGLSFHYAISRAGLLPLSLPGHFPGLRHEEERGQEDLRGLQESSPRLDYPRPVV